MPPAAAAYPDTPPSVGRVTPPSIGRAAPPTTSPSLTPSIGGGLFGSSSAAAGLVETEPGPSGSLLEPGACTVPAGTWPAAIGILTGVGATVLPGGAATGYPSSSAPASTDSELPSSEFGSSFSFGAYVDDATTAAAAATAGREGRGMGLPSAFVLGGVEGPFSGMDAVAAALPVAPVVPVVVEDDLSKLLERLNMAKFRPKFDSKQVCVYVCVCEVCRTGVEVVLEKVHSRSFLVGCCCFCSFPQIVVCIQV